MSNKLLNQRYKFKRVLGQGGMGKVCLTIDTYTNKLVAIKECIVKNIKMVERIKREYYFITKINHPNIVKGLDLLELQGKYFIVMEYVQGITLENFIRKHPRSISFAKQIEIAQKICDAVSAINKNGIIHRDLKPSNIMLEQDGTPKILDLGIAKSINNELATLTNTGDIVGTPQYLSPEQINPKIMVSKNTDVFALGVIFYQFFSWQKHSPFYAGNIISTMDKISNLELAPLSSLKNIQSNFFLTDISAILEQALKKNPQNRVSSSEKMLYYLIKLDEKNQEYLEFENENFTKPNKTSEPKTKTKTAIIKRSPSLTRRIEARNLKKQNNKKILMILLLIFTAFSILIYISS